MLKKLEIQKKEIHILICIKDQLIESNKSCKSFSLDDIKELKMWVKENNLQDKVKITKTLCLGVCAKGSSVLMMYPGQDYYTFETIEDVKSLILENVN